MARVLIPLAEGFEEIEAVTVLDILTRAGVEAVSAGLTDGPITGSRGIVLVPATTLDQVVDEPFDMVVLPGGLPGTTHLRNDPRVKAVVQRIHQQGGYVTAICAAPSAYAEWGLLTGRKATSHPSVREDGHFSGVEYVEDRVVVDGPFVTSRGPGTAMEFAMQLVDLLMGPEAVRQVNEGVMARL